MASPPRPTRFLVFSDVYKLDDFPNPDDLPEVDVVLYCGNIACCGGVDEYGQAIEKLKSLKAELVLVVPGHADYALDESFWISNLEKGDDPDLPTKIRALFHQAQVYDHIRLLRGGSRFTLRNGKTFTIYASPWTPDNHHGAFSFNLDGPDPHNFGPLRVPSVDIVMSHGPPRFPPPKCQDDHEFELDLNLGRHVGGTGLFSRVQRVQPKLHCFGHTPQGYGAQSVLWLDDDEYVLSPPLWDQVLEAQKGETLLVNGALGNHGGEPNKPFVVDMELKHVSEPSSSVSSQPSSLALPPARVPKPGNWASPSALLVGDMRQITLDRPARPEQHGSQVVEETTPIPFPWTV
ncbi:hypothetical protein F4780DRAFT_297545 [Xylariomycetidae sp. FL0641]|nr:hypothetical protein F4780DRAFT_297545 [Xylariomycetidae sp. FL0641]